MNPYVRLLDLYCREHFLVSLGLGGGCNQIKERERCLTSQINIDTLGRIRTEKRDEDAVTE